MEGRRDIKGEKEGVDQESSQERKKVLKERKIITTVIRKYLKKKKKVCWLQTCQASFAGLFACSQLRGPSPALFCSRPALGQCLA